MSSSTSAMSKEDKAAIFNSSASLINTGASMYASFQAANIKSNILKMQARQQELQGKQERLKGVQQSNILRQQLLNNLSSANAMFASRGVDVGSRSAQSIAARSTSNVRKDIELLQSNAEIRAAAAEAGAIDKMFAAKSTQISGRQEFAQQLFGETSQKSIGSLISGFSKKKTATQTKKSDL